MRRIQPTLVIALATGLIALLSGCGSAQPAASLGSGPTLKFRANGTPILNGVTLNVAKSAGSPHVADTTPYMAYEILKKWGANVNVTLGLGSSLIPALIGGHLDAIGLNFDEPVDADLIAFGPSQPGQSYSFITQPSVKKLKDLEGKTVAIAGPATDDDNLLVAMLSKYHIPAQDVKLLDTGNDTASFDAFIAGRADGYWAQPPDIFTLKQKGIKFKTLAIAESIAPFEADSCEFASKSWLDQHPNLAEAVDLAWLYAAKITKKSESQWQNYALQYTKGTATTSVIKETWASVVSENNFPDNATAFNQSDLVRNFQQDVKLGDITKHSSKLSSYADFTPWQAAVAYFDAHPNIPA